MQQLIIQLRHVRRLLLLLLMMMMMCKAIASRRRFIFVKVDVSAPSYFYLRNANFQH